MDATSVYWTNYGLSGAGGNVMKVPAGGGTPVSLASSPFAAQGIAVDATNVYWVAGEGPDGTVMKVATGGGSTTTLASAQGWPQCIAVDATSVYWTTSGSSGNGAQGFLMKLTPK